MEVNQRYDFDKLVDRENMASIREIKTPKILKEKKLISLWGAEFEFPTAPCVTEGIVEWARKGLVAYNIPDDTLLNCIQNWMKLHRNWEMKKEWIVPAYGLTASVATMCRAFTEPGDGVIGFDPVYHMTWEAVELNGRKHISCPLILENSTYRIDYERLEELCKNPQNKMITVCNPHNPIAKVWGREDLCKIAKLAYRYDKIIYSDEIFADQVYEGVEMLTFDQVTDLPVKVIVATSLGKTFSMTGVGQANLIISHRELRGRFVRQRDIDHYGSFNPMMRAAYLSGYTKEGQDWVRVMMRYCWATYLELEKYLAKHIPQMKPIRPEGSFILWLDCRGFGFSKDEQLQKFLQTGGLVCDMGEQYGSEPGFIRINLAAPRSEILRVFEVLYEAIT